MRLFGSAFWATRSARLGSSDYRADVNGDALVDVVDLVEVILAWGECP